MAQDVVLRLLDANLNRAREGFRVLEDTARFLFSHKLLFQALRKERHALDKITRKNYPQLVDSRDAETDAGANMEEESNRQHLGNLIAANFRRCEESLRVLEEYGKVFEPGSSADFKRVRFRTYTLEKKTMALYAKFWGMKYSHETEKR